MNSQSLGSELLAEFFGTFILILFGNGAIAVSVWAGAYGLWPVAFMWGLGVALGVYAAGAVSGAHLNPAVTVAMAAFTDEFDWGRVVPFVLAQIVGAFVASAAIGMAFGGVVAQFEADNGLVRGEPGSELSAMAYTTYAHNPAIIGVGDAPDNPPEGATVTEVDADAITPMWRWFATEVVITAVLVFAIFYLVEGKNEGRPLANMDALFIGLLVTALVAYAAPVSMAALNPARDLGPRLYAALAGWGPIAIPGPRGGFWIPTAATLVGGLAGGAIYNYLYKRVFVGPPDTPGRERPEAESVA